MHLYAESTLIQQGTFYTEGSDGAEGHEYEVPYCLTHMTTGMIGISIGQIPWPNDAVHAEEGLFKVKRCGGASPHSLLPTHDARI
jgi:hypothetical protein